MAELNSETNVTNTIDLEQSFQDLIPLIKNTIDENNEAIFKQNLDIIRIKMADLVACKLKYLFFVAWYDPTINDKIKSYAKENVDNICNIISTLHINREQLLPENISKIGDQKEYI